MDWGMLTQVIGFPLQQNRLEIVNIWLQYHGKMGTRTAYVSGKRKISRNKIENIIIAVMYSVHLQPR
jgi:hypothetical protein